jgi:hypothetical protein
MRRRTTEISFLLLGRNVYALLPLFSIPRYLRHGAMKEEARHNRGWKQQQPTLEELIVAKAELTSGDTSGLVYVQSSHGAAFLIQPRKEVVKLLEGKIASIKKQQQHK